MKYNGFYFWMFKGSMKKVLAFVAPYVASGKKIPPETV